MYIKEKQQGIIYVYYSGECVRKMFNLMTNGSREAAKFEDCRNGESF